MPTTTFKTKSEIDIAKRNSKFAMMKRKVEKEVRLALACTGHELDVHTARAIKLAKRYGMPNPFEKIIPDGTILTDIEDITPFSVSVPKKHFSIWTKLLIFLGMRSPCCGRFMDSFGYAGRIYCSKCDNRIK